MNKITEINGDLLKAVLAGCKVILHKSTAKRHFVIVEQPKGLVLFPHDKEKKWFKYLFFQTSPNFINPNSFWLASSNNHTKKEMAKKIWYEWAEANQIDNKNEYA